MPLIKLRSSSLNDSIDLRGVPTGSELSYIATTAAVQAEISNLIDSSPELLNTLNELSTSLGTDGNQV